jgi:hypothetical protein
MLVSGCLSCVESSPSSTKALPKFKAHFAAAHRKFRLTNQTAQQFGFHSANMMIEDHHYQGTADAIAQLAVETASTAIRWPLLLLPMPS